MEKSKHKNQEFNIKKFMESEEYVQKNKKLKEDINSFPLKIDYSCFKKTPQEKNLLAQAKYDYKNNPKR